MSTYYCIDCARASGLISPLPVTSGVAPTSGYQLDKFLEHTVSGMTGKLKSIFNDGSWASYQGYMVDAVNSGCLEIDAQNRKNLVILAGKGTGATFESGRFVTSCSGVKVVLSEVSGRIHGFPFDIIAESQVCAICGRRVPTA
jgi:hypothetical protein